MTHKLLCYLVLFFSVSIAGCLKKEYLPEVSGAPIPHVEPLATSLQGALETSPYSVFRLAWQRSHMDSIVRARGGTRAHYTLLIPTDAAWAASGWDAARVSSSIPAALDTLLMPYVFRSRITKEQLEGRNVSLRLASLYGYEDIRYSVKDSAYYFQAALDFRGGLLRVNGRPAGRIEPIATTDGYIWPIDHTLELPVKTAWAVLREDDRFSLYTGLMLYTDSLYRAIFQQANGYPPEQGSAAARQYIRNGPSFYDLDVQPGSAGSKPIVRSLNTWFVPTDAAFAEAGFHTLADLVSFNQARGVPRTEWYFPPGLGQTPFYRIVGEFATDTLLDYHHNWGMRVGGFNFTRERNATLFFSTDLRKELLDGYPVSAYTEIRLGSQYPLIGKTTYHYMPLEFPAMGQVRPKGMAAMPSVTISMPDKYTLTGVIHAVDRLMVPEGFER